MTKALSMAFQLLADQAAHPTRVTLTREQYRQLVAELGYLDPKPK